MSSVLDWRATPTFDGLIDYINQQIALGRIGGTNGTVLNNPPDPHDWRTTATQFDGLVNYINQQIALGKVLPIPSAVTAGLAASGLDWRAASSRTGDPLCDFINQAIALGRITAVASPPGTPSLWFDASNVDGLGNSGFVDGQTVGTWKNLGSLGATGDLLQATGALRPLWRSSVPGKINNRPALQSDGTRSMSTVAVTAATQPTHIAMVVRSDALPGLEFFLDGRASGGANRDIILQVSGTAQLASPNQVNIGTMVASKFHSIVGTFNGASSFGMFDGVDTGALNAGTVVWDGLTVFTSQAVSSGLTGYIAEVLAYTGGGQPTRAQIAAYFLAKYGTTPS